MSLRDLRFRTIAAKSGSIMPEVIDAAAGGSEETPVAVMTECDLAGLGRGRHRRPPSKNSWPLSGGEPRVPCIARAKLSSTATGSLERFSGSLH
jgi:hypothetical protein